MQSEVKTYLDLKGITKPEEYFRATEEWQRTHPGRSVWDHKVRGSAERSGCKGMGSPNRKQGECFSCGKPGHYAHECRSKMYKERQSAQQTSVEGLGVKKEPGSEKSVQRRDMSEVTCYNCRQRGHIAPNCPKRDNKVKRVKVCEDQIVSLRRNEIFSAVGPHRMPVTCDTGAEVTVVPEECVEPHQKTGETCVLRSFNDSKTTGECCTPWWYMVHHVHGMVHTMVHGGRLNLHKESCDTAWCKSRLVRMSKSRYGRPTGESVSPEGDDKTSCHDDGGDPVRPARGEGRVPCVGYLGERGSGC